MDFEKLVKARYSVRKFKTDEVEMEKIDRILEVGRMSPSAVNYQPQRILVINSEEAMSKLKKCTTFHFNAPTVFLICYDKESCWKNTDNRESGEVDGSIITTFMMLEVINLGLGTTWVGHFDFKKVREVFELPEYLMPVAMLPIGYPAEDTKPNPLHFKQLPKEKTLFYNSFDGIEHGEAPGMAHKAF